MAKYYGKIGFSMSVEKPEKSGIWVDEIVEKHYRGIHYNDTNVTTSGSDKIVDDIRLNNKISIVADQYAIQHHQYIKYLEFEGCLWKVTSVLIQRPRMILTTGGVYNGPTP